MVGRIERLERAIDEAVKTAPSDGALGVEAFEVPKQQHAEIPTWLQTRPTSSA